MHFQEYSIQQGDTLQRIALGWFRDASRWPEIVEFNNLEAPFIIDQSQEPSFQREIKASGVLTITRSGGDNIAQDRTIPAGSQFGTIKDSYNIQRVYVTTGITVLPAGSPSVNVNVVCQFAGTFGNVQSGLITQVISSGLTFIGAVTNSVAFTTGRIWRIRFVGESILLPVAGLESIAGENQQHPEDALGGIDLHLLTDSGEFGDDNYGDIQMRSGIDNIIQSVQHRLATERGSLIEHPTYGSNIHTYIGRKLPFVEKLIEVEVVETILSDTRIASAELSKIERQGPGLVIEAVIEIQGKSGGQTIRLTV